MARFDVYKNADSLILDCQADLLETLNTRFIVPLFDTKTFPIVAERLNPIVSINDNEYVIYTQFAATLARYDMGEYIINISDHSDAIISALDMLMSGY